MCAINTWRQRSDGICGLFIGVSDSYTGETEISSGKWNYHFINYLRQRRTIIRFARVCTRLCLKDVCMYIYIYIYIERERERDRQREKTIYRYIDREIERVNERELL